MSLPDPMFAHVLFAEKRLTTKNAKPHWFMELRVATDKDKKTNAIGKIWRPDGRPYLPQAGDIIAVTAPEDSRETWGSIDINGFKKIEPDQLPDYARCIMQVPKASADKIQEAFDILEDNSLWEDKKKHKFIIDCFKSVDLKKLRVCPAAQSVHHAYQGGLLIHTAEVVKYLFNIVPVSYPFIDRDVLFGSGIMHDVGKIETYSIDAVGNAITLQEESIIGHFYFGMRIVHNMAESERWAGKIDPKYIKAVLHCVSSHHGDVEYGSMREMQSAEAHFLHVADVLSSEQGKIHKELLGFSENGGPIPEKFKIYENNYWINDRMRKYIEDLKH